MPFLRDDNLTFHRFTTNVSHDSSRRPSNEPFAKPSATEPIPIPHQPATCPTMTSGAFPRPTNTSTKSELSNFAPVWTTAASSAASAAQSAGAAALATPPPPPTPTSPLPLTAIHDPPMYKNSYTMESHDYQYRASSSSRADSVTTDRRKSMQNGSTAKLMLCDDDQSNKQVSGTGDS